MICSAALALSAPLFLSLPQFGEDEVLGQRFEVASEVINVRAGADLPVGYAVLGVTQEPWPARSDLSVVRTDELHNVLWERRIGGADNEFPGNMIQTQDGGLLVACYSFSTGSLEQCAVLMKFDEVGGLLWSRSYRADGGDSVSQDGTNWETRALVEQLPNGNLILISSARGEYSASIGGVQHLLDPDGIPLITWTYEEDWNLPVRMLFRDIAELDGKVVACGELIRTMTPAGFATENSFVALLSETGGSPHWLYQYPMDLSVRDSASSIEFAANGDLLVAGTIGQEIFQQDGYIMRLKGDGSFLWAQSYPRLPMKELIEDVSPDSDPFGLRLIAMGTRVPSVSGGGVLLDACMMITDPTGLPMTCKAYSADAELRGMGLVRHDSSQGYSVNGVFGVSYALDGGGFPPVFSSYQYWLKADGNLKTGCDEIHEQPALPLRASPLPVLLDVDPADGFNTLTWDPVVSDLEVNEVCEEAPIYPTLCFGDGSGSQCPCGNTGSLGRGCANSSGAGAALSGEGLASVSLDSLKLSISGGTPSQPVLFFQGLNFINSGNGNPFGDGLRCCGGGVKRLAVRFMDAAGAASTVGSLSVAGAVSAGTTYCNQGWYRDPLGAGGSPCSTYFNLTNAVSVTWTP